RCKAASGPRSGFVRDRQNFKKQVVLSSDTAFTSSLYAQPLAVAPANAGLLRRRAARSRAETSISRVLISLQRSWSFEGSVFRLNNVVAFGRVELRRVRIELGFVGWMQTTLARQRQLGRHWLGESDSNSR
ncbi:hypothetical protein HII31_11832, partial [Pseudocercospora fuligena]